uniref:Phospholipid scramblase n=1 Tax=Electrophorus electricus TaxID=8005 RepID=A0A4W4FPC2_ELEEL
MHAPSGSHGDDNTTDITQLPPKTGILIPGEEELCPTKKSLIDQLLVHQKVELMEVLLGWETNNQYVVKNSLGQQVFLAAEENNLWTRQLCGPMRSFILHIQNNVGHEVLTLTRPLKCSSCWFPCCLQELEVQAPLGNPLGYVIQEWHPYLPKFTIKNSRKEAVLHIVGSYCHCNCFSDVIFKVTSLDGASVIGKICKQWTGMEFPMDLDVKIKAVILGACFLIDFMYFENSTKQNSHH